MPTPTVNFTRPETVRYFSRPANPRRLLRASDGDTTVIEQPIRLVSCDTPEKAPYAGQPTVSQPKLDRCREWLLDGTYAALPAKLRDYLVPKLAADAAQRHIVAGEAASAAFDVMLENRLTRPDGTKRQMAVIPTGEIVDAYGRLLAYIAPWFTGTAADPLPPWGDPARNTLNLDMVANGWAAFFPLYPSLPSNRDMNLVIAAAETAWDAGLGAWAGDKATFLPGYEFRACIKLADTNGTAQERIDDAFKRICIDLRDLRNVGKWGFWDVPPPYRLWIWEEDLAQATVNLGL